MDEVGKPVPYTEAHVDTEWWTARHVPFRLTLSAKVRPAPILPVGNIQTVLHGADMAMHVSTPHYPRVLVKGDWT